MAWNSVVNICLKFCLVTLVTSSLTAGVVQQFVLHESQNEDGNFYVFKSGVSDLDSHNLGNLTRFCYQGLWAVFTTANYGSLEPYDGETYYATNYTCKNESVWFKSFRFGGAKDTDDDAISLFSDTAFGGKETLFQDIIAIGGLEQHFGSVIWTGTSSWTLVEGTDFTGNKSCLQPPTDGFNGYPYLSTNLGLATVGSIVKGCPTQDG